MFNSMQECPENTPIRKLKSKMTLFGLERMGKYPNLIIPWIFKAWLLVILDIADENKMWHWCNALIDVTTETAVMTKLIDINFFPPTHSSIFDMIREVKGDLQDIPIILVGNKCDENDTREVPQAEGEAQVIKSDRMEEMFVM